LERGFFFLQILLRAARPDRVRGGGSTSWREAGNGVDFVAQPAAIVSDLAFSLPVVRRNVKLDIVRALVLEIVVVRALLAAQRGSGTNPHGRPGTKQVVRAAHRRAAVLCMGQARRRW